MKRVPLDFDWPLNKVWKGYINPNHKPCPANCHRGMTYAAAWVEAIARFLGLMGSQAVEEPRFEEIRARGVLCPHPYFEEFSQAPRFELPRDVSEKIRAEPDQATRMRMLNAHYAVSPPKLLPFTEGIADFIAGLAGKRPQGGLLSSDTNYDIYRKLLEVAGLPEGWDTCKVCGGDALDPAVKEAYEAWKSYEPPTGEGYQLWETTSEGSPTSPVFKTMDELCAWCETNATTFGSAKTSAAEWKRMLEKDFVTHEMEGTDLQTGKPVRMVFI
jgi:hypothetical protein